MPLIIAILLIGLLSSFGVLMGAAVVSILSANNEARREKAGTLGLYAWLSSLVFCLGILGVLLVALFAQIASLL